MDTSEYLGLFLDESRESLQALNASLLDLERDPADGEPLTVIFRVAHSLKGMSATMGFEAMARFTHRMEEVLAAMRDEGAPVTPPTADALFACLDTLQEMVERIAAGDPEEVDASAVTARLDAIGSVDGAAAAKVSGGDEAEAGDAEPEAALAQVAATIAPAPLRGAPRGLSDYQRMVLAEAHERGLAVLRVAVGFDEECRLAAARAFMVVQQVEAVGELIASEPGAESIEAGEVEGSVCFWVAVEGEPDADALQSAVAGISEIATCEVVVVAPEAEARGGDDEAAPASSDAPIDVDAGRQLSQEPVEAMEAPAVKAAPAEAKTGRAPATVRVGTDRLDALMNLMGEMVIQRTRLAQLSDTVEVGGLRAAVEDMTRVTNDLQALIMQVRMMPVEAVFMRFPRMVRDLASALGKRVELIISGEETELDRTVIDGLGDPLVHMLRNAVDHGLETPEERQAAGKDPVGTVRLSARHSGSSMVIEVADDGRGMQPQALRASVVRKGLMDADAAAALSDEEALRLVLLPGFSTAEVTTDVSGRGVGMDAVRSAIADLNGDVAITSTPGAGSTFTIRLPLTLAIIQALLVTAGSPGRVWAVPLEAIEETVIIGPGEVRTVRGLPCVVMRDAIVPLVSLVAALGAEDLAAAPGTDGDTCVVVVRHGASRFGLVVDDLVGTQDVVIKHLPEFLGDVRGVAGATILGDGSVALILDVGALAPAVPRSAS